MALLDFLWNVLYPPHCPGCNGAVKRQGEWCDACFGGVWHPRLIPGSRHGYLDGCYALGDYRGPLREALIGLKFRAQLNKTKGFYTLLAAFPWWERLPITWPVVSVPISAERKRERGFDQTEVLFADFFKERGYTWLPALKKVRHTLPQSGLARLQRKDNIKDSFALEGALGLQNKHIILVDDIYTTGYTMHEAARILHRGGAASIVGLVIASGAD